MARSGRQDPVQTLRSRFAEFVGHRGSPLDDLLAIVRLVRERGWTVFAFGGVPRGVFDVGRLYHPRDLDLVVEDEHFANFEAAFAKHVARRNRFGGLNLRVGNLAVDAWPLRATWAFREGHISTASFASLPKTTFLNVDAVVIEVAARKGKSRRLYEAGFFRSWQDQTLDVNLVPNPFPALCLVRALHIARRYGFKISSRLGFHLWELLHNIPSRELFEAQLTHYGRIDFDIPSLRNIQDKLSDQLSLSTSSPVALFPVRAAQMEFGFPSAIGYRRNREPQTRRGVAVSARPVSADPSPRFSASALVGGIHLS
jgi:hypothetical protein